MNSQSKTARLGRRLIRFSLGTLLIAVLVAGVLFQQFEQVLRDCFRDRSLVVPAEFDFATGKNILWSVQLGSMTWGRPVVAGQKVLVGTNNAAGYIDRFPPSIDLGVLLCFDTADGTFLWQHSNQKLIRGRANDWPLQGVTSTPSVEDDQLWYVTNRGEVVCLDIEGFHDEQDDEIPFVAPPDFEPRHFEKKREADVVWRFDMIQQLDVFPHNASCSGVAVSRDAVFVNTGNGVDEAHTHAHNADAPSVHNAGQENWKVALVGQRRREGRSC